MEALAVSRKNGDEGFISTLPMLSSKIPDLIFGVGLLIGLVYCCSVFMFTRNLPPMKKIRFVLAIPVAGTMFSIWKTRIFASEMGSLLQSGLSMQDALDVLIAQKLDSSS